MPKAGSADAVDGEQSVHRQYVLDIRIVETTGSNGHRYRFEAPHHKAVVFEDPETAELYADVYFDVNGFREAGTGQQGVPPEVVLGGKDTLAAYLLTLPGTDVNWLASFYGCTPDEIERYVSWVRDRAAEIRAGAAKRDDI